MDLRTPESCRWDLVALGEVMLRLDPGDSRVSRARTFHAWEGGGEYNVARALHRVFGQRTSIVTAFADNPVGRLLEDLLYQGGVDQSHVAWRAYDGIGLTTRNGLNFTERGFGVRGGVGCADRGHTAASQLQPGDVDWEVIFGGEGSRIFHTGGIFAALSPTTSQVAAEAISAARRHGTLVSYDLNYRASLWQPAGGPSRAGEVNAELVRGADVLFGNEEDYTAALGLPVAGVDAGFSSLDPRAYATMLEAAFSEYPNLRLAAVTLRQAASASRNDWGALCYADGEVHVAGVRRDLEIYDRVGGGDGFASGLLYGLLSGRDVRSSLELGTAHGALVMTTPGDTSMATLAEVERLARGGSARIVR
ncbi:MAG TPA: sugar kinase [Streptosporangiaceae bacterium]|nr:sugar kinase [Streptosporangiaceae bacterium]